MATPSAVQEENTSYRSLIPTMTNKIKDLEAEVGRLRRNLDKNRVSQGATKLPPYLVVESGQGGKTVVISRQAVKSCQSEPMLHSKLTDVLEIGNEVHPDQIFSGVDERTGKEFSYALLELSAKFDDKNDPTVSSDWYEIAGWDPNILNVVAAATRLKVGLVPLP